MTSTAASVTHDDTATAAGEGGSRTSAADTTASSGEAASLTDAAAPATTAAAVKQTRASLSIHDKSIVKSFCEQRVDESKVRGEVVPSQDLLRREVQSKFGWEMGRSTLSKIMTMDWKALSPGVHRNPNMKRKRKPLFPDFEADLVKYIGAHIAQHEARAVAVAAAAADMSVTVGDSSTSAMMQVAFVDDKPELMTHSKFAVLQQAKRPFVLTEAVILEEAQRLKKAHGIRDEELVLSVGWLARFKHRNGIRLRKGASGKQQPHHQSLGHHAPSSSFSSDLLFEDVASGVPAAAILAVEPAPFVKVTEKADPVEPVNILLVADSRAPMVLPKDGEDRAALFRALVAGDEDRSAVRRRRASL